MVAAAVPVVPEELTLRKKPRKKSLKKKRLTLEVAWTCSAEMVTAVTIKQSSNKTIETGDEIDTLTDVLPDFGVWFGIFFVYVIP